MMCLLVLQTHDINVRGRDLEESDSTDDEVDTDTDTGDEHGNPPPTPCVAGACAAAAARLNAAQVDLVAAQVRDVVCLVCGVWDTDVWVGRRPQCVQ